MRKIDYVRAYAIHILAEHFLHLCSKQPVLSHQTPGTTLLNFPRHIPTHILTTNPPSSRLVSMSTITLQTLIDAMRTNPITEPERSLYLSHAPDDHDSNAGYGTLYNNFAAVFDDLNPLAHPHPLKPLQGCAIGEAALQLAHLASDCISAYKQDVYKTNDPWKLTGVTNHADPDEHNYYYDAQDLIDVLTKCVEGTAVTRDLPTNGPRLNDDDAPSDGEALADDPEHESYNVWTRAEYWYSYALADAYERVPLFDNERPSRLDSLLYAAHELGFEVA